jgi:hypothetical protein
MSSAISTVEWEPSAIDWETTTTSPPTRVIPFPIPQLLPAIEQYEWSARPPHHAGLESRVKELKGYCEEDGVTLRARSQDDFWTFIESPQLARSSSKFDVVATDHGNLRAIYDESDVHIGVEFLGDQICEYVVWSADTPPTGARATVAHTLKLIHNLLHR